MHCVSNLDKFQSTWWIQWGRFTEWLRVKDNATALPLSLFLTSKNLLKTYLWASLRLSPVEYSVTTMGCCEQSRALCILQYWTCWVVGLKKTSYRIDVSKTQPLRKILPAQVVLLKLLAVLPCFQTRVCVYDVTSFLCFVDNRMNLNSIWTRHSTVSLIISLYCGAGYLATNIVLVVYASHTLHPPLQQFEKETEYRNFCDVLTGTYKQCDSSIERALEAGACYSLKPVCFLIGLQKAAGYVKRAENKACSVKWRHN